MKAVYRRRGERRRSVSIADWEETVLNLNARCDVEANEKVVCETAEFYRGPNRLPRTNGSIALDRRIDTENLDYVPRAYFPDVGDDMGLFFRLLLHNLPLERVGFVWKTTKNIWELPSTTDPIQFHRQYSREFSQLLAVKANLWKWKKVTQDFLHRKCPPRVKNEFKWIGFHLSPAEIPHIAMQTTLQYGMARLGKEDV